LSRHLEQSQPQREDPSSDASGSLGADDCIGVDVYNTTLTGGKTCPLTTGFTTTGTCPKVMVSKTVCYSVDQGGGKSACNVQEGKAPTLACTHGGEPAVCYGIGAVPQKTRYIVRRLTPLECERLQGFPDGWTDIGEYIDSNGKKKQSSDAARYKALGNSIALPSWKWVLKRLCACYERDATMASLFSGIGGFDLLWTQLNGPDSVLWESEIEEFPSAVCRRHFGDEATGEKGDYYGRAN
jgi:DNA (cytosine-5)-methyltransferase 1